MLNHFQVICSIGMQHYLLPKTPNTMVLSYIWRCNYPKSPPKVNCLPVCITTMFMDSGFVWIFWVHTIHQPYNGWSSSYSVLSILLQLQSFLLEKEDTTLYIKVDFATSKMYRNHSVNHDPSKGKVWPCASHWDVAVVLGKKKAKRTKGRS